MYEKLGLNYLSSVGQVLEILIIVHDSRRVEKLIAIFGFLHSWITCLRLLKFVSVLAHGPASLHIGTYFQHSDSGFSSLLTIL